MPRCKVEANVFIHWKLYSNEMESGVDAELHRNLSVQRPWLHKDGKLALLRAAFFVVAAVIVIHVKPTW